MCRCCGRAMSEPAVTVLFFAAARDVVGMRQIDLELPTGSITVAELADLIAQRFPALVPYMRSLRIAVNGEYARADAMVHTGDEVAVIPPVAGG